MQIFHGILMIYNESSMDRENMRLTEEGRKNN
jgi:hypothetical protein